MPTTKELQGQLRELTDVLEQLLTHVEVLALAVRKRGSVPQADLDDVLQGVSALRSRSIELRRETDIDATKNEKKATPRRRRPAAG
jgi:hypothetical protein